MVTLASGTPSITLPVLAPIYLNDDIIQVYSNGLTGSFSPDGILARGVAPEPQVIPHSQAILDLSSGFPSPKRHYRVTLGADFWNINASSYTSPTSILYGQLERSTNGSTDFVCKERQAPVVIYRPLEKKDSGRRLCQCACAMNIQGLRIDKDDLYTSVGHGRGTISIHECHWAKFSDPCGMGSRSRVGAHIRKWNSQKYVDSRVRYLWDGCTTSKAMLKDSINHHVVTVDLHERFYCQGCNQVFSRRDVYDQHVEGGKVCKDAGATIVYGTERWVIDTSGIGARRTCVSLCRSLV
ncbi:hypothetical protein OG21DRAFT_1601388 [Imleria badia]|nr:hypothetical protein OG21DRAFT_1601388 [Imleria badia]